MKCLHTESCPDKNCGTSLNMPGLIGEVTEIEGRSIFWDSNELEPVIINKNTLYIVEVMHIFQHSSTEMVEI